MRSCPLVRTFETKADPFDVMIPLAVREVAPVPPLAIDTGVDKDIVTLPETLEIEIPVPAVKVAAEGAELVVPIRS